MDGLKPIKKLKYWCNAVLPLAYDDSLSYMELLNKVAYKLNEVIANNNELPDYIKNEITSYISDGTIKEIIGEILANYGISKNVLQYGADNTGANDSTTAFNKAFTGGGVIYIPKGEYLINSAKIESDTIILSDGATLKANGNNILINKSNGEGEYKACHNVTIYGVRFVSELNSDCTLLGFGHSKDITIENCVFDKTYSWHQLEINSCDGVTIRNNTFENYGDGGNISEMLQLDYASADYVFPWFGPYDNTPCKNISIVDNKFVGSGKYGNLIPSGIGNHTYTESAEISNINIEGNKFENLGSALKFVTCKNLTFNDNIVVNCQSGIWCDSCDGFTADGNIMHGRSVYSNNESTRGIYFRYNNKVLNDITVSNNDVGYFGGHGVTIQGTNILFANNKVHDNGADGCYVGYKENNSYYDGNLVYSNNKLEQEGYYDIYVRGLSSGINAENVCLNGNIANTVGVTFDANNCGFKFVNNNVKTSVNYGNNITKNNIIMKGNIIANDYNQKRLTKNLNVTTVNAWTELYNYTFTESGFYNVRGQWGSNAKLGGSLRFNASEDGVSFDYSGSTNNYYHYVPISMTKYFNVGDTINLQGYFSESHSTYMVLDIQKI